jgi:hypothetical protein
VWDSKEKQHDNSNMKVETMIKHVSDLFLDTIFIRICYDIINFSKWKGKKMRKRFCYIIMALPVLFLGYSETFAVDPVLPAFAKIYQLQDDVTEESIAFEIVEGYNEIFEELNLFFTDFNMEYEDNNNFQNP